MALLFNSAELLRFVGQLFIASLSQASFNYYMLFLFLWGGVGVILVKFFRDRQWRSNRMAGSEFRLTGTNLLFSFEYYKLARYSSEIAALRTCALECDKNLGFASPLFVRIRQPRQNDLYRQVLLLVRYKCSSVDLNLVDVVFIAVKKGIKFFTVMLVLMYFTCLK